MRRVPRRDGRKTTDELLEDYGRTDVAYRPKLRCSDSGQGRWATVASRRLWVSSQPRSCGWTNPTIWSRSV